ncbi:MAG: hypothetical protein JOZ53_09360, partial [Planctomycetaceae bacterium]|nr:hypothetical protein [Planctomycetaceae bacterium]
MLSSTADLRVVRRRGVGRHPATGRDSAVSDAQACAHPLLAGDRWRATGYFDLGASPSGIAGRLTGDGVDDPERAGVVGDDVGAEGEPLRESLALPPGTA